VHGAYCINDKDLAVLLCNMHYAIRNTHFLMHYAYAFELYFDSTTDAAVRGVHQALATANIGDSRSHDIFHPHISLTVGQDVDVEASLPVLEAFASATPAFPVTLSYLGIFTPGDSAILYLGVTVTSALLELHRAFTAHMAPLMGEVWAYYSEGVWVPHCTLAMGIRRADMPAALARTEAINLPVIARVESVALVRVTRRGGELVTRFPLASTSQND
jgi:2'-5' RNA ligase